MAKTIKIDGREYTMEELQGLFDLLGFIIDVNDLTPEQIAEIEKLLKKMGLTYQIAAIKIGTPGGG